MADKINIEIDLEGGAEVEKQLADIGKAGQQAFGDIQNAANQIDLSSATDALNNVQTAVQGAATLEKLVQGVGKVESAFDALGNAASKMATRLTRSLGVLGVFARALGPVGIALGVAAGAFVKFGDDAADALNGLTVAAAKLGQTPQQLDRVTQAFAQLGVAPDTVIKGLEQFQQAFGNLNSLQNFIGTLERMPDSVRRTQFAIQMLGDALGGQVIAGLQAGTLSAQSFAAALQGVTPATQQQIVEATKYQVALNQLNAAWTALKREMTPIITPLLGFLTDELKNLRIDIRNLVLEWQFLKAVAETFLAPMDKQKEAADRAAEAYKRLGTGAQQLAQEASQSALQTTAGMNQATGATTQTAQAAARATEQFGQMGAAGAQAGEQTANSMGAATQAMGNFIITTQRGLVVLENVTETAARAAQFIANLDRPTSIPLLSASRPDRLAGGGLLGGRGTGTSDSNLAWVSRGEHIMPARAVAQPGVLALLEALRKSGGNLRGVLDGMGRFALGGLVPRLPAFAGGGSVGGMSHVTIQFPGVPPVVGLRASVTVVNELRQAAALAQVRSGGRKPSRYS